jgi:hypothetical protein
LHCICIYENEHQDVENNEIENDSTATIIYDENGILVKKKISKAVIIDDSKNIKEIKNK